MRFTDIHQCTVVHKCDYIAVAYADFRGSLSLVCGRHVQTIAENYDADFYTAAGEAMDV